MTVGEFREKTSHLPDESEIVIDQGDLFFYEVRIRGVLQPEGELPSAVWLEMGQEVTLDKDLDARLDKYLEGF